MSAVLSHSAADLDVPVDHPSVDEIEAAIGKLVRQMNADSYRMLVLVRDFDDRFGWKKGLYKSCAEWLAWRASLSLSAAREKVRTAHALRGLPAIAAAFEAGRLSYSKVRALTRVAQLHDEDLLLAYALNASVPQVEERCRQIRNVSPSSVDHARLIWARRSLTAWRDEARGTIRLNVELPIEDGELLLRALDFAVASGEVTTGIDSEPVAESRGESWRAQQADALVAVVRSYLDGGGSDGGSTADHYQVVVHADANSLTGGAGRADLPIETVKRLLCDCSVVTVVEDEHGKPLDVGRKQRTVPTALRRALYARDRGCTFPGCHRKRYLDGHHLHHWVHGGATSAENMTLLCTYHHRKLHEGGFRMVREEDGALRFVMADERRIPQCGHRRASFVDDDGVVDATDGRNPSREGSGTDEREGMEVREPRAVYRLDRAVHAAISLS